MAETPIFTFVFKSLWFTENLEISSQSKIQNPKSKIE